MTCGGECLKRYDPREDPLEFCTLLSMISLGIGMILVAVGYIVPRDFHFDPNRNAREMEAIQMYYTTLGKQLDICIIVGMICVGAGAMAMAIVLMIVLCRGELSHMFKPDQGAGNNKNTRYYGASHSQDRPIMQTEMADLDSLNHGRTSTGNVGHMTTN